MRGTEKDNGKKKSFMAYSWKQTTSNAIPLVIMVVSHSFLFTDPVTALETGSDDGLESTRLRMVAGPKLYNSWLLP